MTNQENKPPIRAVLFDLDDTLVRAQMTEFVVRYVESLARYCSTRVKPKKFVKAMRRIIYELIHESGDGLATNEERIFARMQTELNLDREWILEALQSFAEEDLAALQVLVRPVPLAGKIVRDIRASGVPMVLATNPVFPKFMVQARMRWGDLREDDFVHISSIENSYHCKPHPQYFENLAAMLGLQPEECLMVGNDINHDLGAAAVGMRAFLVDTWVIDRGDQEWPYNERGDHSALLSYLQQHRVC
jgi:FMN phosphatase YigB (HAD superfamily)